MSSPTKKPLISVATCAAGISLYALNKINIIKFSDTLYHPFLALSLGQIWRVPLSFLTTSTSFSSLLSRSISLLTIHSSLETTINYPLALSIATSSILVLDSLFYRTPSIASNFVTITPYALFPSLDYCMRWIHASNSIGHYSLFNMISISPIYTPLIACAFNGFNDIGDLIIGLGAALVVVHIMDLKKRDNNGNIVRVFDVFIETGLFWGKFIYRKFRRFIRKEDGNDAAEESDGVALSFFSSDMTTAGIALLVQVASALAAASASGGLSIGMTNAFNEAVGSLPSIWNLVN